MPSAEGVTLGGKALPSYVPITPDGQTLVGETARRRRGPSRARAKRAGFAVLRDSPDLWRTETIEPPDAVLGTRLRIPTFEKPAGIKVPPATQQGTVLRLVGRDLPTFGEQRRGNLHMRLRVLVRHRLSDEERELYGRLQQLSATRKRPGEAAGTPS